MPEEESAKHQVLAAIVAAGQVAEDVLDGDEELVAFLTEEQPSDSSEVVDEEAVAQLEQLEGEVWWTDQEVMSHLCRWLAPEYYEIKRVLDQVKDEFGVDTFDQCVLAMFRLHGELCGDARRAA